MISYGEKIITDRLTDRHEWIDKDHALKWSVQKHAYILKRTYLKLHNTKPTNQMVNPL